MLDARKEWRGLKGVGMVYREVEINGNKSSEYAYFIGSVNTVKQLEKAVRNHWQVESFHWSLDVTYRDDANKTRTGNAAQDLALINIIACNVVKKETRVTPHES